MKKILFFVFINLFLSQINGQCWQSVSAGGAHTLSLTNSGSLWTWGRNNVGQLGTAGVPATFSNIPIQIGTDTNWFKISCGNAHNLALKINGTLWAWGRNTGGQLGNNTTTNSTIPIQIGTDSDWLFIAAGDEYSVALKNNGTLWTWGTNTNGQLGDGTIVNKLIPTQIGSDTTWQFIAAGTDHTLGTKTNGTLWAWGRNNTGQLGDNTIVNKTAPIQIGTDTNWQTVMASILHSVGLKIDGSLWTWGSNTNGQLGDNTTVDKIVPTNINPSVVYTTISKGHQHSLAKKHDTTLWAWGGNVSGQLGDGSNSQKNIPTEVSGVNMDWSFVVSKLTHTAALKNDGSLWMWGSNLYGQLGDGSNSAKNTPVIINCPTLSVSSFDYSSLKIFPNPGNSIITITGEDLGKFKLITITDLTGKIVFETSELISQINVSSFADGLYVIQAVTDEKIYLKKFIKN